MQQGTSALVPWFKVENASHHPDEGLHRRSKISPLNCSSGLLCSSCLPFVLPLVRASMMFRFIVLVIRVHVTLALVSQLRLLQHFLLAMICRNLASAL